jgi:nucleoside-diphosphate-sugar epimerase
MPTNLYGPGDNFNPDNSHVLPSLIRRFHSAVIQGIDEVAVWGSGRPRREFLHVDDMADACLFVMNLDRETYALHTQPMLSHLNVGTGTDVSIAELAELVANITNFRGCITFDLTKPDGTMRKLMDVSRLKTLGWTAKTELSEGIRKTYAWFLDNYGALRDV